MPPTTLNSEEPVLGGIETGEMKIRRRGGAPA